MCAIDCRAAEDHEIALMASDDGYSTRFPISVDNIELSPNMQDLPMEKAGWTGTVET